jgi:ABC-type uncharacterized transport system involved in gliding motility auxiliary subunit
MARKKVTASRYAFIGLIFAGLGCIATGLLTIVQGAINLKIFTPARPETISEGILISAAVLILGLAIYGILNPDGVRRFFSGRQVHYGSNTVVMSLAFLGILFVINYFVFKNPNHLDFTEDQQHTLAPQTIQALATLPNKVTAIGFFTSNTPNDTAKQLLTDYKTNSKGKFDYQFVDPNLNPLLAQKYGVTGDGKIVLTMGKSAETAASASETDIDTALIRLISPQERTVYFLTGHGEPDIDGTDPGALSRARSTLQSKNYTVKTLNLASDNKIPDDAKAIIEAGPANPLLDQEVVLLKAYVDKGGSLIVLEDPTPFTKFGNNPDPLADYLKNDWGLTLENDVVIDLTSQQPLNAISSSYNSTAPITQHMTAVTIMPQARSITISKSLGQNISDIGLIQTSQNSWGETNLASIQNNQQISYDQATDIAGPLTVAASGENSVTNGRVVVFGNSIFATDKGFDAYANGDIFINSIDWAAQQGNLINITPRTPISRTFNPPSQLIVLIILISSVIIIPGLIVVAGFSTWLARRRQG